MFNRLQKFAKYSLPFLLSHPLWPGASRFLPLLRVLRLQLIFSLGETEIWLPWIGELVLLLRRGDSGLTGNYYVGLHEFRDMAFVAHLLRPGDLFVDIGANLGSYSLIASGLCSASSIAYEPVPTTCRRLRRVVEVNSLDSLVDARCCALSAPGGSVNMRDEGLWFSVDRDTCNSFVDYSYPGRKEKVVVSSVDDDLRGLSPVLFKIDVEGFEQGVLAGARRILAKKSCLAVIIEGQTEPVDQCLASMGFREVDYDPLVREISTPSGLRFSNKIWIKESMLEGIEERVKSAPFRSVYARKF